MNRNSNPYDDFKTIGEVHGERRGPNPWSFWVVMLIVAVVVGYVAGGGLYVAFEFWRNSPSSHNHGLRRMARRSLEADPVSKEELHRRIRLCAQWGALAGLVIGAGYCLSAAARERREFQFQEEHRRQGREAPHDDHEGP